MTNEEAAGSEIDRAYKIWIGDVEVATYTKTRDRKPERLPGVLAAWESKSSEINQPAWRTL